MFYLFLLETNTPLNTKNATGSKGTCCIFAIESKQINSSSRLVYLCHVNGLRQYWQLRNSTISMYCRLISRSFFVTYTTVELTWWFHTALPSYEPCHVKPVQSILLCSSELSTDVTNIRLGCCEQQFPPNWKALRPFRPWCYLAPAFPSWPSIEDEHLYISCLSLLI